MSDERAVEMFAPDVYLTPFERIARIDENGVRYWSARDMMTALEYSSWQYFKPVIKRAMAACKAFKIMSEDHFMLTHEMVALGSGSAREVESYRLTEDACYLIAMNGDPSKKVVASAQMYFVQLAKAESIRRKHEAEQRKLQRGRAVTGYVNSGHSVEWSNQRVDSKGSVTHLNGAAQDTHETNAPDYAKIHGEINQGLLLMSRKEVIAHLGLNSAQADKFRDHLGGLALETLTKANHAIAIKMNKMGRPLTADEQLAIVRDVVAILGPSMRNLAEFIEIDFVSGAPLDEYGQPLITRNLPLLTGGAA